MQVSLISYMNLYRIAAISTCQLPFFLGKIFTLYCLLLFASLIRKPTALYTFVWRIFYGVPKKKFPRPLQHSIPILYICTQIYKAKSPVPRKISLLPAINRDFATNGLTAVFPQCYCVLALSFFTFSYLSLYIFLLFLSVFVFIYCLAIILAPRRNTA
jgi:hypothetical protein